MATKLDFSFFMVKNDFNVKEDGDKIQALFNQFVDALRTENLDDVRLNFEDGKDEVEKIYQLCTFMNAVKPDDTLAKDLSAAAERAYENGKTAALEDIKRAAIEHDAAQVVIDTMNKYPEDAETGDHKLPDGEFQNNALSEIIGKLESCKSVFRGSSDAFEDILKTAKTMQKVLMDNSAALLKNGIQAKITHMFAETLADKMDKYIADRESVAINFGKDSYKGKRVHTMIELSQKLMAYKKCTEHAMSNEVKGTTAHTCQKIFKAVYENEPYSEEHLRLVLGTEISPREKSLLKELYNGKTPTCGSAAYMLRKYRVFVNIVKDDLAECKKAGLTTDAGKAALGMLYNKIESLVSDNRANLTIFDSMFDENVRYSHITGDFFKDKIILKDVLGQMNVFCRKHHININEIKIAGQQANEAAQQAKQPENVPTV